VEDGIDATMHLVANHQIQRGKEKKKNKAGIREDAIVSSDVGPVAQHVIIF
jgi:hypothetical protein